MPIAFQGQRSRSSRDRGRDSSRESEKDRCRDRENMIETDTGIREDSHVFIVLE